MNNKNWSAIIKVNIEDPTPKRMLNLMTAILATKDLELLAQFCVEMMVFADVLDFNNNFDLLRQLLKEDGWVAYDFLTNQENITSFISRDDILDFFFGKYSQDISDRIALIINNSPDV